MTGEVQENGRRMLVEFTCGRCGKVELVPYIDSTHYNVISNMHSNPLPPDWRAANGGIPLLCDCCAAALELFMSKGAPPEEKIE
jgi:hypothetical protein